MTNLNPPLRLQKERVLPIGMRGTSYEMVVHLFQNGFLSANPSRTERLGKSLIYFWPIRENWEANGLTPPMPWKGGYCDPVKSAEEFAFTQAVNDYFRKSCGFSLYDYECQHTEETRRKVQLAMTKRGLTNEDISKLIVDANLRRGYILEFHPDLVRDHTLSPDDWFGDNVTAAFQVECPRGIEIKYISKITPIREWDAKLMGRYLKTSKSHHSLIQNN